MKRVLGYFISVVVSIVMMGVFSNKATAGVFLNAVSAERSAGMFLNAVSTEHSAGMFLNAPDTLGLEVFSMELDAVTVTAKSRRDYKRLKKSDKEGLIEAFKQKLRVDFPRVKSEYKVLSGYRLLQDTVVMTSGSMTGTFVELPKAKKSGGDSLAVVDAVYKEYVNAVLKRNMEEMERREQVARQKRDSMLAAQTPTDNDATVVLNNTSGTARSVEMRESGAESITEIGIKSNAEHSVTNSAANSVVGSTTNSAASSATNSAASSANVISLGGKNAQQEVHKLLWGVSPAVVLDELEDLKGKWDYIPNGDGTSYVVFRGHKGFLGIVRVEWAINYLVDSKTLGVIKITENLDAKLSIPFGMSIKGEDLEALNMLNVAYGSFDSFKFRKGTISLKRYVEYANGLPVEQSDENVASNAVVNAAVDADVDAGVKRPVTKVLDMDLRVIGKQDKEIHMKAAAKAETL